MTRPLTTRLLLGVALASLMTAVLVAAPASAQTINNQLGQFGTYVKVGDFDYLPLTKRASSAVRVLEADVGKPGDVTDNCIVLLQDNADSGAARAVALAPAGATTPATAVYTRDIRLTPCFGKAVGTAITTDDVMENLVTYVQRGVETRYFDADANGKYSRGDPVYITTMTGATRGLAATTGLGTWTIRLTKVGEFQPGSFALASDPDFLQARASATGATPPVGPGGVATGAAARTFSQAEREGNAWYIVAASAGLAAQSSIPVNSIRIGLVGAFNQQPLLNPSNIDLPDEAPQAGETYKIVVKFSNDGTGSGVGLLVTKVNGAIVDARLTPVLGAGEGAQVIIPVPMPDHGGPILLQVGDSKVHLDVEGTAAGVADFAGPSTTDLEARIAELEAKLAAQDDDVEHAKAGVPGLAPAMLMGALAAVVALLRRRAA